MRLEVLVLQPEALDLRRALEVAVDEARGELGDLTRDGDKATIDGEITIKGITQPATLTGTIVGPTVDHFGATRIGLTLETVVDRTAFDIKWNMPLPSGEPALGNEVTLKADLTLVAQEA